MLSRPASCLSVFLLTLSLHLTAQKNLHENAIVVDTHNDVLSTATMKGLNIEDDLRGKTHSDLSRFRKGGVDIQIFSIFCDEKFGKGTAFRQAIREIDSLDAIVARNPDKIMLVNSVADLREAVRLHRIGAMKGVEGGHMIEDRMDYLDSLYHRGARYLTLTWNNSTSWASSAWDETFLDSGKPTTITKKGLNEFGRDVVKHMNELGMLVDLSHVGPQTFYDALAVSKKPVIVSHSCAWAICPVPRNLTDDQIRAIGKNGGVIHLNFYSGFLDSSYNRHKQAFLDRHQSEADSLKSLQWPSYEIDDYISKKYVEEADSLRPSMNVLLNHLDHIVDLIGVNHVGLGSDFDGIESAPQDLDGVEDMPVITSALIVRGYSKKEIKKILGGNFVRLLKANEK
ncbi:dipeptidase [Flavihumibacter petaseus]|uniref:Putative dipeptidase n=1 Tax=Flavihumibacter petaseus NBRC 106054 TaxID=1220578 RepID=A0A0E9MXG5_9BACT|nr:dipeptidase [Flavihumibacter petaseus]GAO42198.1 putative dipeptidase [Flavihumibacter petaseus NBRC 106054]